MLKIKRPSYWLSADQIAKVEQQYDAKFIGSFCGKAALGFWSEEALDVFYVADPDYVKGHSNYFGIFFRRGETTDEWISYITNAESCFSEPIACCIHEDEVYVSRYRHDYVEFGEQHDYFIDGGRDYTRTNHPVSTMRIHEGEFYVDCAGITRDVKRVKFI